MAGVLHTVRCKTCEATTDAIVQPPDFGTCDACGGERTWVPVGFYTDVREPVYCHATGQTHSSHREAEMVLAQQARKWSDQHGMRWEPHAAGDPVGGARTELSIKGTASSYNGQGSRQSTGERRRTRQRSQQRQQQARQDDTTFKGVRGRRMSRDEAIAYRKAPTHNEVQPTR